MKMTPQPFKQGKQGDAVCGTSTTQQLACPVKDAECSVKQTHVSSTHLEQCQLVSHVVQLMTQQPKGSLCLGAQG